MSFHIERESGSDWCIKDSKGAVKASGLDQEEAQTTADQWNSKDQKEKKKFVENA